MDARTERELAATVAARRELGPEHDDELIAGFLERIERQLETRHASPAELDPEEQKGMQFVMALVSLGVSIPVTAIAISHGLVALAIAWIGIVFLNVAFARGAR